MELNSTSSLSGCWNKKKRGMGVPVYRGCRRRAFSTPRLRTVKAFGLKSRASRTYYSYSTFIAAFFFSPKG